MRHLPSGSGLWYKTGHAVAPLRGIFEKMMRLTGNLPNAAYLAHQPLIDGYVVTPCLAIKLTGFVRQIQSVRP